MVTPAGYGLVTFGMTGEGDTDEMVSTWGVLITDTSDLNTDLGDMADAWKTAVESYVSDTIIQTTHRLYQSPADGGDIVEVSRDGVALGTVSTAICPNNTSYVIKKTCAIGGRKHRGRIFLPGVPVANTVDSGSVDASVITAFNAELLTFISGFPYGGLSEYSLLHSGVDTPNEVVILTCQARLGTTRHRYQN